MIRSFGINKLGLISMLLAVEEPGELDYRLVSDGLIVYRKWIQEGYYVIDYSDDGGTNWTLAIVSLNPTEENIVIQIDESPVGYRDLVRVGAYVIDQVLTPTGFAGIENIDWVQVYYLKPV